MSAPLADQLLKRGMHDLDIGLVLARLHEEHFELDGTEFLAEVWAPNRIQAIETFIWHHLRPTFGGRHFALTPDFIRSHIDWAGAWRLLRNLHGMACVQLPKEKSQPLVRFLFVAGRNDQCPREPDLNKNLANPNDSDQLIWRADQPVINKP